MDRLQKKCLLSSAGFHGFLLLCLAFGSAFFVSKPKEMPQSRLQFVPTRIVENALSGGGGNPNIARTDDVQKGSPTAPKQLMEPPAQAPKPSPTPPKPAPPEPDSEPVAETKPAAKPPEPVKTPPKPVTKKPAPTKPVETAKPKPTDKPPEKPAPVKPRIDLSDLKPVTRTTDDKRKAEAEEEAREQAREHARQVERQRQQRIADGKRIAERFNRAASDVQQLGFEDGTKVVVGGPGGEAYASYGAIVQDAYQRAWKVQTRLFPELNDEDFTGEVRVVIARDGRVVDSRIVRRSTSAAMNRCLQRTLDSVRQISQPFPAYITESERPFNIEFNLKTNRTTG